MRTSGTKFGCNDCDRPIVYSDYLLSRCIDMLDAASILGGDELKNSVFQVLPESMKLEFNYSRWVYVMA